MQTKEDAQQHWTERVFEAYLSCGVLKGWNRETDGKQDAKGAQPFEWTLNS
jgi:hypothetical protein